VSDPALFEPPDGPPGGWPADAPMERAYLEAFAREGAPALISNLRTRVLGLQSGGRVFPVTVNDGEYGDSYVCLPHTAYALYAKAELGMVDVGPFAPALRLLAGGAGGVMRAAAMNRIVHVGNWMLSTNLHGGWKGEDVGAIRGLVAKAYPDHLICVRSVNGWSDPALLAALRSDGWALLPSRQIWVVDDLARDWRPRRDTRRDLALARCTRFLRDDLATLRPGDADRIAELYAMLYLDRYSALNPAFTSAYVAMTHAQKVFRYAGFRGLDGRLAAVAGCFVRGGVLTTPILGYDTAQPAEEGLYRLASLAFAEIAEALGARLNGSAGAASFKRNRGARAQTEYMAIYAAHLSPPRRAVVGAMRALLQGVALPIMQKRGL
jgi:hypothetical protein